MTIHRIFALGCVLGLLTAGCMGNVGPGQADSGAPPPSRGGTAGTSIGPGAAGATGVAGMGDAVGTGGTGGASGVAGSSGSSGGTGPTGVAGATGGGPAGTGGGSAGRGGSTGSAGMAGAGGGAAGGRGGGAAGTTGAAGAAGSGGDPAGWVPALIGVGYGGIRIVSRDGGKTWGDRAYLTREGGDDQALLRAIVYGKGMWIATGWNLWTSANGTTWTDRGRLEDGPLRECGIVEGLAFKDGYFFAACSLGDVYRSTDGIAWTKIANMGNTGGHLYLNYRGGKFVAYGDTKTSFQSTDAMTWTVMSGIQEATYCENTWKSRTDCKDSSWFDGAYLRADWQGVISRSTDGRSFTTVYDDDQLNTLYRSSAMAAGFVAPK